MVPPLGAESHEKSPPIVRIEEDWELALGAPDTGAESPQIRCVISPTRDLRSLHAVLTLNHRTEPIYESGGMQLQVWDGENPQASKSAGTTALLSHEGEVVRWTQVMRISDDKLVFEVVDGRSKSWGRFGFPGRLKLTAPTVRTDLSKYHPRVSWKYSEVEFGENRVKDFVLREVRAYGPDGLLWRGAGSSLE